MSSSFRPIFMCLISIFLLTNVCDGFNIDTASKKIFDGPNQGSYYGYSIAMLDDAARSGDKWILIGAPKDNSTFLKGVTNPGAVYKCTLSGSVDSCEELFVDDKDDSDQADFNKISRIFVHGRDNQWLGASLDVDKRAGIVTCASRWYNKYFEPEEKGGYFFMNGLCYEIPLDFNQRNIRKIPALVDGTKQTITVRNSTKLNYGMGSLGSSVHYSNEGTDLLLGAPGLRTWTGGFVDLRGDDSYILNYDKPATEISEMAGYAMTSGNYFGEQYFAIGAPRAHLAGKVYLFAAEYRNYVLEYADFTLDGSDLIEVPVNGYFGAALCSVDVNNDGLDDLLVAAPFYSKGVNDDTGMVFIYLGNREDLKFKPQSSLLTGNEVAGARFGSSIASLGDMNNDNYNDVIIGAPYEDNGRGAIYVYNGCKTGLWPRYSQKIEAKTISSELMSFGISFSKAEDMNGDDQNDIAVGAYLSDKVFLFYGQYVINVDLSVRPSVQQIDKDNSDKCLSQDGQAMVPCFRVDVCFYYDERVYSSIDVNVTLMLDTYMGDYSRIAFQNGQSKISKDLRIFSSQQSCIRDQKVLIKSTSDLVTPVRIEASYEVIDIMQTGSYLATVNKFDGSKPNNQLLLSSAVLDFKKDCPNNDCKTDLHVSAEAMYDQSNNNYYIIGSTLALDVTISKTGDPSYSSNFFIAFPNTLQFQKVTKIHGDTEVSCGFVADQTDEEEGDEDDDTESLDYLQRKNIPKRTKDEILMMCSFGNPMSNDTGVRFKLHVHVPQSFNRTSLTFRLNATTLSTELKPADNVRNITVGVRNKVATTFMGVSRPSDTTIKDRTESYIVSHIYELRNKGPSPLPAASLMIQYPQIQKSGKPLLFLNITSWNCPPPCWIECSFPDSDNTAPIVHASHVGPTYVHEENTNEENIGESRTISNMKNINCNDDECSRYECELYDIPARESAVVKLEYVAMGDILQSVSDGNGMTIRSKSYITLKQLHRLIYDTMEHYTSVGTDLLPVSPPPQKVPWWIYVVSILGGIILIIIVIIILWKLGFFKRKRVEDMKKLQHTGEVEKMIPDEEEGNGVKS